MRYERDMISDFMMPILCDIAEYHHFWFQQDVAPAQPTINFVKQFFPGMATRFNDSRLLSVGLFEIKDLCKQAKDPIRT